MSERSLPKRSTDMSKIHLLLLLFSAMLHIVSVYYYWHTKLKIWIQNEMFGACLNHKRERGTRLWCCYCSCSCCYYVQLRVLFDAVIFSFYYFFCNFACFSMFKTTTHTIHMYCYAAMQHATSVTYIHISFSPYCSLCLITIWKCAALTSWTL